MFNYTKDVHSSFYWPVLVLIHLQLSLLSDAGLISHLKTMPTTERTCLDFILWVSLFLNTFTTKTYDVSYSLIPAMNRLKAGDTLVGVFKTYAYDDIIDHALWERKQRESYQWKGAEQGGQGVPR